MESFKPTFLENFDQTACVVLAVRGFLDGSITGVPMFVDHRLSEDNLHLENEVLSLYNCVEATAFLKSCLLESVGGFWTEAVCSAQISVPQDKTDSVQNKNLTKIDKIIDWHAFLVGFPDGLSLKTIEHLQNKKGKDNLGFLHITREHFDPKAIDEDSMDAVEIFLENKFWPELDAPTMWILDVTSDQLNLPDFFAQPIDSLKTTIKISNRLVKLNIETEERACDPAEILNKWKMQWNKDRDQCLNWAREKIQNYQSNDNKDNAENNFKR